jgi:hypothetical protein
VAASAGMPVSIVTKTPSPVCFPFTLRHVVVYRRVSDGYYNALRFLEASGLTWEHFMKQRDAGVVVFLAKQVDTLSYFEVHTGEGGERGIFVSPDLMSHVVRFLSPTLELRFKQCHASNAMIMPLCIWQSVAASTSSTSSSSSSSQGYVSGGVDYFGTFMNSMHHRQTTQHEIALEQEKTKRQLAIEKELTQRQVALSKEETERMRLQADVASLRKRIHELENEQTKRQRTKQPSSSVDEDPADF